MNEEQEKQIIDPDRYYSPRKLVCMKILPWSSAMTFNKKLKEPKWKELFNPIVDTSSGRIFMRIKGENIITFLTMAKDGQFN